MAAANHRPDPSETDWLTKESDKDLSYPNVIDKIKMKILQLNPTSKVDIYKYARQVSFAAQENVNGWGRAAVSARFVVLEESSLT